MVVCWVTQHLFLVVLRDQPQIDQPLCFFLMQGAGASERVRRLRHGGVPGGVRRPVHRAPSGHLPAPPAAHLLRRRLAQLRHRGDGGGRPAHVTMVTVPLLPHGERGGRHPRVRGE